MLLNLYECNEHNILLNHTAPLRGHNLPRLLMLGDKGVQNLLREVENLLCGIENLLCGVENLLGEVENLLCGIENLLCGVETYFMGSGTYFMELEPTLWGWNLLCGIGTYFVGLSTARRRVSPLDSWTWPASTAVTDPSPRTPAHSRRRLHTPQEDILN